MASTEEKLLTLLLSVEHLQHTAMEQQKAVADSLAVARETLRGYRDISDGVAKQVRDEVRNEVQKLDVAGLIGERISQDFQRLEESVANMKANADALNRDIATIHSNIVQEYNTLKGYSWKWLGGVSVAFRSIGPQTPFSGYVLCARMGNENNTRQELQRHSGGVSESCDTGR